LNRSLDTAVVPEVLRNSGGGAGERDREPPLKVFRSMARYQRAALRKVVTPRNSVGAPKNRRSAIGGADGRVRSNW
jgi:hypothetical protein